MIEDVGSFNPEPYKLTEKLAERKHPEQEVAEFIESSPPELKELAQRETTLHRRFWAELSPEHPAVQQIKKILEDLLDQAGFSRDFLAVTIFDSNYPDVHVQMFAHEVRVSRAFLELVEGNVEEVAAVLAHEVGHMLLAHYVTSAKDPDPLNERIQSYEHEYQADRASVILTNRLGIRAETLADTLSKIEGDLYSREAVHDEEGQTIEGFNHGAWILSTHPYTPRRVLTIHRESGWLPKYKRRFAHQNISVPEQNEFTNPDFDVWDAWGNIRPGFYMDCLWEEIDPPAVLREHLKNLEIETEIQLKKTNVTKAEVENILGRPSECILDQSSKTPPIEATPEEVAFWTESSHKEAYQWWQQALRVLDSRDGYEDLSKEIRQYPLGAVKLLLQHACPEYTSMAEAIGGAEAEGPRKIDEDAIKDFFAHDLVYTGQAAFSQREMPILISLLIRSWFERDSKLKTLDGLGDLCEFLRTFSREHGVYLPYSGGRIFIAFENFFTDSASELERQEVASLFRNYESELNQATFGSVELSGFLMPKLKGYIEEKFPQPPVRTVREKITKWMYQLPDEISDYVAKQNLSREEARQALQMVPYDFRPENLRPRFWLAPSK